MPESCSNAASIARRKCWLVCSRWRTYIVEMHIMSMFCITLLESHMLHEVTHLYRVGFLHDGIDPGIAR